MKLKLPADYSQLEYLGRGPWENYCDRNSSTYVGRYTSTVAQQYVPYVRPQDNGHKTDVRWLALSRKDGIGLLVVAGKTVEFTTLNFPIEDFDAGQDKNLYLRHINDLHQQTLVELHLDLQVMGLGGDNSWEAMPHKEYLIQPNLAGYKYSFTFIPFASPKTIDEMGRLKF